MAPGEFCAMTRLMFLIGFQESGPNSPVSWLEVTPAGRLFSICWEEKNQGQDGDLSGLFKELALEIKPGCLVFELGNNSGCFLK